jgi:hypothetical protein
MTDNAVDETARIDTRMVDGEGGLNMAALALLVGCSPTEANQWVTDGSMLKPAVQAMRRRTSEARAALNLADMHMIDVITYYEIQERKSLRVDDVVIIDHGKYVGP